MDLENPKPGRFSRRLSSFLFFLFVSSTAVNPFHQPPPPPSNDPAQKYPESTQEQIDSDMSEYKESNKDELAFLTTSSLPHQLINISSASVSSSSEISTCGEENIRSSSPPLLIRHNSISATRVSREEAPSGRSDATVASIPPYPSPSLSSSSSAIFTREEEATTVSSLSPRDSFPAQSETTTTRRGSNNKFLRVMEIMDERDLGKHLLGLAIPTGVGLVVSNNSLVKTTEMHMVAITLSLAIAFIWNALLLRKTYTKTSTLILISGAAFMMLSFYSLVSCFIPSYLKWIPFLCFLASLIPFAMYGWEYFQRDKAGDPEKGDRLTTGKPFVQSHTSN